MQEQKLPFGAKPLGPLSPLSLEQILTAHGDPALLPRRFQSRM